jgi:hypothetical protein
MSASRRTAHPPAPSHCPSPPLFAHARHLPCSQRARRGRAMCAARRCPSGPEPPRPCRAGSRGTAPWPLPLRSFSCSHAAPSRTPCLPLFFAATRPSVFKSAGRRPALRSASSHPRSSTSPPPLSTLDSVCQPQTLGLPRSPARFRPPSSPSPLPPGETHQSAAISRFGAPLTSLVFPCSSRS